MPLDFTFLMCPERSGSNLITRMFDAHPDCRGVMDRIAARPYAPFFTGEPVHA
ncbi:MAG: hypothetical protein ABR506_00675 [Candidatus Krumholzibacteriia bacterium]